MKQFVKERKRRKRNPPGDLKDLTVRWRRNKDTSSGNIGQEWESGMKSDNLGGKQHVHDDP